MKNFWIIFTDGTRGTCQGVTPQDAKRIAEHKMQKKVETCSPLPYPASPIIWQFDHPINGKTPDFCYTPDKCSGRTSCPKAPSCVD